MNRLIGLYGKNNNARENVLKLTDNINYKANYKSIFYCDDDVFINGLVFSDKDLTSKRFETNDDNSIIIGIDGFIQDIEDLTILESYKKYGEDLFLKLNGQFSIVIVDKIKGKLFLVRDRFGQKPLFYTCVGENIYFASEINPLKYILQNIKINEEYLMDICTTWSGIGDNTFYKDISSVECGSYITFSKGKIEKNRYFDLNILERKDDVSEEELINEIDVLLNDSIKRKMAENENFAFYLSGGLDSSLIASIAARHKNGRIDTFSISFEDKNYDETEYQNIVSKHVNSNHKSLFVSHDDIISNIESVVKVINSPILKTGLSPMLLLSKFVKDNGFDAVLSGEGADEAFGGYDIYKEVKIREFCEKDPESKWRPLLYKRLYSYVNGYDNINQASLTSFFNQININEMFSSHFTRFKLGDYCYQFFTDEIRETLKGYDIKKELEANLPIHYNEFSNIAKAQYLEIQTFLNNYLLLIQGDCVAMSNGISCKYPFLDNKVSEFAFSLKDKYKIKVLNEKYILKKLADKYLPQEFSKRKKFPFRAPVDCIGILKNERLVSYITEDRINKANIFNSKAILKFINNLKKKEVFSEREQSLLMFIVSVQILMDA